MKILVFGGAGKAGSRFLQEGLRRGHEMTAALRSMARAPELPPEAKVLLADPGDSAMKAGILQGQDALILAMGSADFGIWRRSAENLVRCLQSLPDPIPRILHMGGGASLLAPDGSRYFDHADFPDFIRAAALGQIEALEYYQSLSDPRISWLYLSPPPTNFEVGKRTGHYRVGLDEALLDASGKSSLSYEDFAVALLDEIEQKKFDRRRITFGY